MKITDLVLSELSSLANEKKKQVLQRYFNTEEGGYGYGDKFIGVSVPTVRKVAKSCLPLQLSQISELLDSPWHDLRLCGLFVMIFQLEKTRKASWLKDHTKEQAFELQRDYFDLYLSKTSGINNWDLVDVSAPKIVGEYLWDKDKSILYHLAESPNLWQVRISVVSTLAFIKKGDLNHTFALAEKLMHYPHHLIEKAVGWMLREAGKVDEGRLMCFLDTFAGKMPRTMLRYSIEKFDSQDRQHYLSIGKA